MNSESRHVDIRLAPGILRIEPLAAHTFRVRLRPDEHRREPALIRYGILRRDWPPVPFDLTEEAGQIQIRTAEGGLSLDRAAGLLTLRDAGGHLLTQEAGPAWSDSERGFGAEYALADGERLYGLGDETRETIQKRGHLARMWVTNVACYVPIPFLMSSRGWALLLNTTWRHSFDVGKSRPDRLRFSGPRGELDYYLFIGHDYATLLDRYTALAGRPHLLPRWAYGLTFVCNQQANAREMLDDALNLRREGIPCDVIGLEPGWMEKHYDFSVEKKWHPERFYIPHWAPRGPQTFLGAAERLGFKMSLWLCCDYDLSYEEEREADAAEPQVEQPAAPHADDFEQDQHFGLPDLRMDKLTRPDEPWFAHLKPFVDQGVSAFKLDGSNQVIGHPDRAWGNGMSDEEMHNLYPTLLSKQMHLGFQAHTGRRSMTYSSGGYVGIQKYGATWAGDTGGGPKPLISMLNHGLSGHVNVSCDMDVFTPAGIHFGFWQPWAQVCSWAYWRHPWLLGEQLLPIFKHYAHLRYRLLPYIYSQAHLAARTGLPIMRAMALAYPDDPQSDALVSQYLFGDAFLVAAFTDRVHLPAGRWIDYWSGETYEGPQDVTLTWPAECGGPLLVRAGAIIPYGPAMDYVGQKPLGDLELHIYPEGESRFSLFEDDGVSYAHQEGAVARTAISCRAEPGRVRVQIGPRQGSYEGMPATRSFELWLYADRAPGQVQIEGRGTAWRYDETSRAIRLRVFEDEARQAPVVVEYTGRN